MSMRLWLGLAGVNGAMAVALGAYAAHGLSGSGVQVIEWMEKAVRYQLAHALGLGLVVVLLLVLPAQAGSRAGTVTRLLNATGALWTAGILFFCGTLYTLALSGANIAFLAPIGGFSFIFGWISLLLAALVLRKS